MTDSDGIPTAAYIFGPTKYGRKTVDLRPPKDSNLWSAELVRREDVLQKIEDVWQDCLDKKGLTSDKAFGMKILARELKYELREEIEGTEEASTNSTNKNGEE